MATAYPGKNPYAEQSRYSRDVTDQMNRVQDLEDDRTDDDLRGVAVEDDFTTWMAITGGPNHIIRKNVSGNGTPYVDFAITDALSTVTLPRAIHHKDSEIYVVETVSQRHRLRAYNEAGVLQRTYPGVTLSLNFTSDAGADWIGDYATSIPSHGWSFFPLSSGDVVALGSITGDDGGNEIQTLTVTGGAGNFTLTFDGQSTGDIAHDATAGTVEGALLGLSNIDAFDVDVTGEDGGPWEVAFLGQYFATDVSLLTSASGDGVTLNIVETHKGHDGSMHTFFIGEAAQQQGFAYPVLVWLDSAGNVTNSALLDESLRSKIGFAQNATPGAVVVHDGKVYVLVGDTAHVQRYSGDETGTEEVDWDTTITATDFAIDSNGNVFVANNGGFDIKVFDIDGVLQDTLGEKGDELGKFPGAPLTVRVPNDTRLYVLDEGADQSTGQRMSVMNAGTGAGILEWTYGRVLTGDTPGPDSYSEMSAYISGGDVRSMNDEYGAKLITDNALFDFGGGASPQSGDMSAIAANHITDVRTAIERLVRKRPFVGAARNAQQTVTVVSGEGTFTLTFDGQTTGNLDFDATAAEIDAELEGLSNIGAGDVAVTGAEGGPWTVTFTGALAGTDVPVMDGTGDSTALRIAETAVGVGIGTARLNMLNLDANNAYFRAMGDRSSYGSLVAGYDWQHDIGAMGGINTFDIDIGELPGLLLELENATV